MAPRVKRLRLQSAMAFALAIVALAIVAPATAVDDSALRRVIREASLTPYGSFKPAADFRYPDVTTGHPLSQPLIGHTSGDSTLAFSPDGKTLASGSFEKSVRLWHVPTGQPHGTSGCIVPPSTVISVPMSESAWRDRIRSFEISAIEAKASPRNPMERT